MRPLSPIRATPEQVKLSTTNRFGVDVIRGAAGTGKTSTGLLKLRSMYHLVEQQRHADADERPIKILVLTFNRTLCGYIEAFLDQTMRERFRANVQLATFAKWAVDHIGQRRIIDGPAEKSLIESYGARLPLEPSFLCEEVDYILGRFLPADLNIYLSVERTGRGAEPRVEQALRQQILNDVIVPFISHLRKEGLWTWNDYAVAMIDTPRSLDYDIVLVDEAQDFSANQIRAIQRHIAQPLHCAAFVLDTVQRIYARGFTWRETGVSVSPARAHKLVENHRNTREIAQFAAGILTGMNVDDDGALPNLVDVPQHGALPRVITGLYREQVAWTINSLRQMDLTKETVSFLGFSPGYFSFLKDALRRAGIAFEDLTRQRDWPVSETNVSLCTFHSAKGLEFDHVFILGLAKLNTGHGDPDRDDKLTTLRRLFAMGVCRAKKTVAIGYKEGEESDLVQYFMDGTFVKDEL